MPYRGTVVFPYEPLKERRLFEAQFIEAYMLKL